MLRGSKEPIGYDTRAEIKDILHRQKEVCLSILGHEVMRSDIDEVYTATLYNKMETT